MGECKNFGSWRYNNWQARLWTIKAAHFDIWPPYGLQGEATSVGEALLKRQAHITEKARRKLLCWRSPAEILNSCVEAFSACVTVCCRTQPVCSCLIKICCFPSQRNNQFYVVANRVWFSSTICGYLTLTLKFFAQYGC